MLQLSYSLNIILPIFFIIFLGWYLRRIRVIDAHFVTIASKLVFNVAMPTLVFLKVAALDFTEEINFAPIFVGLFLIVIIFALLWIIGLRFIQSGRDLGVFIQGSYRSNFGIIGLAIAGSIYGDQGYSLAALYLAFVIPVFNVLAIISLTVPMGRERGINMLMMAKTIVTNPLIIGVLVGLGFSLFSIAVPPLVERTGYYLADLTLPLALIGVGGVLQIRDRDYSVTVMMFTCLVKLVLAPVVGVSAAILLGYEPIDVVMIFLMFGCPSAAASFVMADAMGANRQLAGASVVFSTIFSALSLTLGLLFLTMMGYIPVTTMT